MTVKSESDGSPNSCVVTNSSSTSNINDSITANDNEFDIIETFRSNKKN